MVGLDDLRGLFQPYRFHGTSTRGWDARAGMHPVLLPASLPSSCLLWTVRSETLCPLLPAEAASSFGAREFSEAAACPKRAACNGVVSRSEIKLSFSAFGERARGSPTRELAASSSSPRFISPVPWQPLRMLAHQGLLSLLMALYK